MQCPLSCGQCCEYWHDVFPDMQGSVCPHETDAGCALSLIQRPGVCREYLCAAACHVIAGTLTHAEGELLVEQCLQDQPNRWNALLREKQEVK